MNVNYYVAMFDRRSNIPGDGTWYRLVGPFVNPEAAAPYVSKASSVARSLDFRADFCSFGVIASDSGKAGVLNPKVLDGTGVPEHCEASLVVATMLPDPQGSLASTTH